MGYREIKRIRKDIRELKKDSFNNIIFCIVFWVAGFVCLLEGFLYIGILLTNLSVCIFSIMIGMWVKIGRLKSNIFIIKKFEREIKNLREQIKK